MDGVLVIDKPTGLTSFQVVREVRKLLRVKKVGHTGTLDPAASGVLPLCLGEATKVAQLLTDQDKAYHAVIRLGQVTDTQDADGKVLAEAEVPALSRPLLESALAKFLGPTLQTPPMFSAIKVAGKRLYELAREGREVERTARPVNVFALTLTGFSVDELSVEVHCSKGFYVRTLAHDLGQSLGCGGHLKGLRRVQSGRFTLAGALSLEALTEGLAKERLLGLSDALSHLPALFVSAKDAEKVLHGVSLEVGQQELSGKVRVVSSEGRLLAVGDLEGRRLRYFRVLGPAKGAQ